jgi:DnaJ like chaperone protein
VAGFDVYAKRIADMFGPANETLCDIMDGLFHIAMADGGYHPAEDEFLIEVARIFGMEETRFRNLRARHVPDALADPYAILGLEPGATYDEARAAWKAAVRECHPDRLAARGLPEEAVGMAERRLVDLNRAWEEITATRSRASAPVA